MRHLWLRRWGLLAAAALLLAYAWAPTAARAQAAAADEYVPGEVLVKLRSPADFAGVAQDYGLAPAPLGQFGARPIYRAAIVGGGAPPQVAAALAADPRVAAAEPNYVGQTPEGAAKSSWAGGDGGSGYAEQWAAHRIRLPEAHTRSRGAGIRVAVLDTGVDLTHPDLAARLGPGYDFVGMDADPREEGSVADAAYGHGTHVASMVALAAPDATIIPVRMLAPDGSGNLWVAIEALAFAANPDGDPHTTHDSADVINLSFSFPRESRLLDQFVREVTCEDDDREPGDEDLCGATGESGAVFVAAAGNSSAGTPEYPAAESVAGMLAVAASTEADTLANFSNHGSWIHLAAPGERIIGSVPGGYGVWSGTSMAAPLVAGAAALVRAREPGLSAIVAASRVMSAAADIGGAVPRRLDAAVALGMPRSYGDIRCRGAIAAIPVSSVTVPSGASCTLNRTIVAGAVKVGSGASLRATGALVRGGVEGAAAANVALTGGAVAGSVVVKDGVAATLDGVQVAGDVQLEKNRGILTIAGSALDGALQIKENSGGVTIQASRAGGIQLEKNARTLRIANNVIDGDVQVTENGGGVTIQANTISGALQCEKNAPAPTGGGNSAAKAEGQCARL